MVSSLWFFGLSYLQRRPETVCMIVVADSSLVIWAAEIRYQELSQLDAVRLEADSFLLPLATLYHPCPQSSSQKPK